MQYHTNLKMQMILNNLAYGTVSTKISFHYSVIVRPVQIYGQDEEI